MAGSMDFETQLQGDTRDFVTAFRDAINTVSSLGSASDASTQNLEQMSEYGRQHIQSLNLSLAQARAELIHLSTTNATPQDIQNAENRVGLLETAISQAGTVFNAFGAHAQHAMQEAANAAGNATAELTPFQNQVSGLVSNLDNVRMSLDENGNSATHTRQQLEQMAQNATQQLQLYERQLEEARLEVNRLSATNASPQDIELARQRVQQLETGVGQVTTSLDAFQDAARTSNDTLQQGARDSESALEKVNKGVNGAKFAVGALVAAMATVGLGLSVEGLAQAADSYTNLSARINIATKEGGNFNQAMAGVHQVALATNSNLTTTADLFTRLNTVGKDMGMTQQQTLELTKTVTQAIKIGGGSAEAADAAVQQFIQAMQGGVLRGEEFNSIMEGGYGLAEALAKGLGVTTGELRKMAEAGELSSERVVKAIGSQAASVQATYDKFPTTIGNALQRISTSWEILIGKMDQANGASSTVAQWLVELADNIQYLQVFIDDIGEGFVWIGDKLQSIDSSTISTLKSTLSEAYETVKSLISNVATLGETIWSAFTTALDSVSPLFAAFTSGKEDVSGLEVVLNMLRMAFAGVSDVATGFNIGLKLLLSGIQFLSGGLYALSSQVLDFLGFDTLAQQALSASDRMFAQAEKNGSEAVKLAENHKWAVVQTYEDIGKTEEQKNQESVANNQKTLDELRGQEEKHKTDYKAISDQRLQLEQQLHDARKTGNQASIDLAIKGLTDLDAKEKSYQAESQKITDAKVKAAQDWVIAQLTAADGTQKAADLATQKTLQTALAAQGLKVEFDSAGKAIVAAMAGAVVATEAQGNATDKARKAAQALGLDLDVALNRVSEKFTANKVHLDNYANGLTAMGAKGTQATEALYQGWEKWAEAAKNPAEIDAAKAKLLEFEKQGVFSAKQVQIGMEYLDQVNGKIPENISEVEKAYKLLGITSSAEAGKIAESQIRAFNVMKQSGVASAEQIRQALMNMADKIYASGDAAKIAWYEGQLAANGLTSSVNQAGKVTIDAGGQMENSINRVTNATQGAQQGFRDLGAVAREEAQSSSEAWANALKAQKGGIHATPKGTKTRLAFDQSGVEEELKALGYDEKKAVEIAKNIISNSKLGDGYRNASGTWLAKNGLDIVGSFIGGGGGTSNANYVREQLERYSQNSDKSSVSLGFDGSKTVKYEITTEKNTATVYGSPSTEVNLNSILGELETIKKST